MTDLDSGPPAVTDWATDFDHTHQEWAQNAPEIWADLRERCPMARTERFGGAWLPTRFEDVSAIAYDTDHFTSNGVVVSALRPEQEPGLGGAPPITSDPPFHKDARRLLLPAFSPKAVEALEPATREACNSLIDLILERGDGKADAAVEYAQHIPVMVIANMLGLPPDDGDRFRVFIHRILETPGSEEEVTETETLDYYIAGAMEDHRTNPRDDLIGHLLNIRVDGQPLTDEHISGTVALLIIAGIDTTWSALGASIWHLAQHPKDRQRLAAQPDLIPTAVEEFLRAFGSVTMARLVKEDVTVAGAEMKEGEWVLLPFPAANRDPEMFEDADRIVIDRQRNRHSAFGLGIHRCVGSNLARMELNVALEVWMQRIPEFELADPNAIRWSTGQVRGPRLLPLVLRQT